MIDRRELVQICRQIGTMTEVGVDFLRILRVLREQTDNSLLLALYHRLEATMSAGGNLSDALATEPELFSDFAVSIIEAGEENGDIEGAWHRLADYFKQEALEDRAFQDFKAAPVVAPPLSLSADFSGLENTIWKSAVLVAAAIFLSPFVAWFIRNYAMETVAFVALLVLFPLALIWLWKATSSETPKPPEAKGEEPEVLENPFA